MIQNVQCSEVNGVTLFADENQKNIKHVSRIAARHGTLPSETDIPLLVQRVLPVVECSFRHIMFLIKMHVYLQQVLRLGLRHHICESVTQVLAVVN
jgi:hypothetical protein